MLLKKRYPLPDGLQMFFPCCAGILNIIKSLAGELITSAATSKSLFVDAAIVKGANLKTEIGSPGYLPFQGAASRAGLPKIYAIAADDAATADHFFHHGFPLWQG